MTEGRGTWNRNGTWDRDGQKKKKLAQTVSFVCLFKSRCLRKPAGSKDGGRPNLIIL